MAKNVTAARRGQPAAKMKFAGERTTPFPAHERKER